MILEVRQAGHYVIQTVHGSFVVEHLAPGNDYSYLIERIISGPYDDAKSADGRWLLSGHRIATAKLSEHLSWLAQGIPVVQDKAALESDLQEIRDTFSGDPKKLNKLIQ